MTAIAGVLERRLGTLTLPLAVVLPGGQSIGPASAAVTLRLNDMAPLGHLVIGRIGKVGQDYVEGRMEFDGSVRQLMALAAELMPGDPTPRRAPPGHHPQPAPARVREPAHR